MRAEAWRSGRRRAFWQTRRSPKRPLRCTTRSPRVKGVEADGLGIDLRENVLSIEGRVAEAESGNEQLLLREYETGSFRREFRLTNLIDQAKIDAALRDGTTALRWARSTT